MSYPPEPTCAQCDAELVDIDMMEDPDDPAHRWMIARCPQCEPTPAEAP